jgi:hypothetical protein
LQQLQNDAENGDIPIPDMMRPSRPFRSPDIPLDPNGLMQLRNLLDNEQSSIVNIRKPIMLLFIITHSYDTYGESPATNIEKYHPDYDIVVFRNYLFQFTELNPRSSTSAEYMMHYVALIKQQISQVDI